MTDACPPFPPVPWPAHRHPSALERAIGPRLTQPFPPPPRVTNPSGHLQSQRDGRFPAISVTRRNVPRAFPENVGIAGERVMVRVDAEGDDRPGTGTVAIGPVRVGPVDGGGHGSLL